MRYPRWFDIPEKTREAARFAGFVQARSWCESFVCSSWDFTAGVLLLDKVIRTPGHAGPGDPSPPSYFVHEEMNFGPGVLWAVWKVELLPNSPDPTISPRKK